MNPNDPDLLSNLRVVVAMLAVGYACDDDSVVCRSLDDLGAMLGVTAGFAAGIEAGMLERGMLVGPAHEPAAARGGATGRSVH